MEQNNDRSFIDGPAPMTIDQHYDYVLNSINETIVSSGYCKEQPDLRNRPEILCQLINIALIDLYPDYVVIIKRVDFNSEQKRLHFVFELLKTPGGLCKVNIDRS